MDIKELQRRAGIINEAEDIGRLWNEFGRMTRTLIKALQKTEISPSEFGKEPYGVLSPQQIGILALQVKQLEGALESLDQQHHWRDALEKRKSGMDLHSLRYWSPDE